MDISLTFFQGGWLCAFVAIISRAEKGIGTNLNGCNCTEHYSTYTYSLMIVHVRSCLRSVWVLVMCGSVRSYVRSLGSEGADTPWNFTLTWERAWLGMRVVDIGAAPGSKSYPRSLFSRRKKRCRREPKGMEVKIGRKILASR